jgi:predicted  nucleic acid-binding Zn-ribbon protein
MDLDSVSHTEPAGPPDLSGHEGVAATKVEPRSEDGAGAPTQAGADLSTAASALRLQATRITELEAETRRLLDAMEAARAATAREAAARVISDRTLAVLEQELAGTRTQLAQAREQLDLIHNSRLWRYTAFPRRIYHLCRRLAGLASTP